MNILILHAHNEQKSFNSALKNIAVEHFESRGDDVKVKDLYEMNFNPVPSRDDFKTIANPEYFSYMKEQMNAFLTDSFSDEIKAEIEDLKWADMLVLNFPLWWSTTPAILKGWLDKVLAFGFAYHPRDKKYETGIFKGKRAFCCVTSGGSSSAYSAAGEHGDILDIMHHLNHGTLNYCGMSVYPPFVAWQAHLMPPEVLDKYKVEYKKYLKKLETTEFLY